MMDSTDIDTGCFIDSGNKHGTGTIVDNDADNDGVCDTDEIEGCTDVNACNYDSSATNDDGLCSYADNGYDCDEK